MRCPKIFFEFFISYQYFHPLSKTYWQGICFDSFRKPNNVIENSFDVRYWLNKYMSHYFSKRLMSLSVSFFYLVLARQACTTLNFLNRKFYFTHMHFLCNVKTVPRTISTRKVNFGQTISCFRIIHTSLWISCFKQFFYFSFATFQQNKTKGIAATQWYWRIKTFGIGKTPIHRSCCENGRKC